MPITRIRCSVVYSAVLVLSMTAVCSMPAVVTSQTGPSRPLDIETIMQDPKWIGEAPSGVVWSDDSRWIYFQWNPEGKDFPDFYKVGPQGGDPVPVSLEELQSLRARPR